MTIAPKELKSQLPIPRGSKFNPVRALELANLIERAYQHYGYYDRGEEWFPEQSRQLIGSKTCDHDLDHSNNSSGRVEYQILHFFYFTLYWYLRRRFWQPIEVVPLGFIAKRRLEDDRLGIFIVFRGTLEEAEWVNNFKFRQTPFLDAGGSIGKVSRGFQTIFTRSDQNPTSYRRVILNQILRHDGKNPSIREAIANTLEQVAEDAEIFVTGHSLGAALATMATLQIATQTKFKQPILYTFASPRVGDPDFAQQFRRNRLQCYRIANSEDLVTTVPPATLAGVSTDVIDNPKLSPQRKVKITKGSNSLRSHLRFFLGGSLKQRYEHIGEPLYFTAQEGALADNHSLWEVYRPALPSCAEIFDKNMS